MVGNAGGPGKPVVPWVRVGIGFYRFFLCVLPEGGDVFQMQTRLSLGRRSVSLTSCGLSFKSPLSVTALTDVRNRDVEVYLVTASCWQGAMEEPSASGLITRGVVQGTAVVDHFHPHQRHL
jgi:hypothetical protein